MVLVDGNNAPVAVCVRKSKLLGQSFKIYSTGPLYPGQNPSGRKYNQCTLYTHAKVDQDFLSSVQQVTLDNESSPSYTVQQLWPMNRVVKQHDERPAAFITGGPLEDNWHSYLLTINPGIDPCLMVCLVAICDEMDKIGK
jgi:hypothetical protein